MYPLLLLTNPTNEGLEALNSGERNLSRESIDTLLDPTTRKGRGKALKTLLAEAEAKKRVGEDSHKAKKRTTHPAMTIPLAESFGHTPVRRNAQFRGV